MPRGTELVRLRSRLPCRGGCLLRRGWEVLRPDGAADLPAYWRIDHVLVALAGSWGCGVAGRHVLVDRPQRHWKGSGFAAGRTRNDGAQDASRPGGGQRGPCGGGSRADRGNTARRRRPVGRCRHGAVRRARPADTAGSRTAAVSAGGRGGGLAGRTRVASPGGISVAGRDDWSTCAERAWPGRSGRWRHGAPGHPRRRRQRFGRPGSGKSENRLRATSEFGRCPGLRASGKSENRLRATSQHGRCPGLRASGKAGAGRGGLRGQGTRSGRGQACASHYRSRPARPHRMSCSHGRSQRRRALDHRGQASSGRGQRAGGQYRRHRGRRRQAGHPLPGRLAREGGARPGLVSLRTLHEGSASCGGRFPARRHR
jgi:hypothetical protein